MKNKRIILTGGAGFIGSCFLWRLNCEGVSDIIVVDNLGHSNKWRNLLGKKFSDYIQKEDCLNMLGENKLGAIDAIVHLGACSSTTLTDGAYFVHNNYEYSKALALWARKNGARFIYASSAATYGDGSMGYDDDENELFKLRPLNMYGYSKQLFDSWMLRNGYLEGSVGVKFFNVFGPNEYHKGDMMSVVCKSYENALREGVIKLFISYKNCFKDGEQKRDFIYVKDAVDALYYLMDHPRVNGLFNLGTGIARSWNDLAKSMFVALGKKTAIEYIEMPETLRPKYQYFTQANVDKLKKAGYPCEFMSLEGAVKDYCTYLVDGKNL